MNIIIDKIDFWDEFECMRYWSHPSTYSPIKRKQECYNYVMSGVCVVVRQVWKALM